MKDMRKAGRVDGIYQINGIFEGKAAENFGQD
jgi:hypothetical protein